MLVMSNPYSLNCTPLSPIAITNQYRYSCAQHDNIHHQVYSVDIWCWISLLWAIVNCQDKVSVDRYHVTIYWEIRKRIRTYFCVGVSCWIISDRSGKETQSWLLCFIFATRPFSITYSISKFNGQWQGQWQCQWLGQWQGKSQHSSFCVI